MQGVRLMVMIPLQAIGIELGELDFTDRELALTKPIKSVYPESSSSLLPGGSLCHWCQGSDDLYASPSPLLLHWRWEPPASNAEDDPIGRRNNRLELRELDFIQSIRRPFDSRHSLISACLSHDEVTSSLDDENARALRLNQCTFRPSPLEVIESLTLPSIQGKHSL
jgi:hypothetical protein